MDELLGALLELLDEHFSNISKPLRKNIALLTVAFVRVLASARSGYGRLSLASLSRVLPSQGSFHTREKRLHRFMKNQRLDHRSVATGLAHVVLGQRKGFVPFLLDQTKTGPTQALLAAVPYAGRALPLALYTFDYPLTEPNIKSQNQLEHIFLLDTETSVPDGIRPVWIADRGYARAMLLMQSHSEKRAYIIRGRAGTGITFRQHRKKLHQLPARPFQALRYPDVQYHARYKIPVDVVVYTEPRYENAWHLLVPTALRDLLSPEMVVDLYRERMQIEQSFRDFKTHLGLRGLQLKLDVAARMGRLLLAFLLAYVLCLLLGESHLGQLARDSFECPRRTPRHGTKRTLSALIIASLILSHSQWMEQALRLLIEIIYSLNNNSTDNSDEPYILAIQIPP